MNHRLGAGVPRPHVIAVEGDVDVAERDGASTELPDEGVEPLRQDRASRVNADEGQALGAGILLDDLVGDSPQRSPQIIALEHDLLTLSTRCAHTQTPSWPLRTGLKVPTRRT